MLSAVSHPQNACGASSRGCESCGVMVPIGGLKEEARCHVANGNRSITEGGAVGSSLLTSHSAQGRFLEIASRGGEGADAVMSLATRPYTWLENV